MERTEIFRKFRTQLDNKTGSTSFLELIGNGELLISGCLGICDYTAEEIKVDTLLGRIVICGAGLKLAVYRGDIMSIEGSVSVIKLGER
ncbi:MAG: YabP/YqfC family sporulation protein [Clostridia bacterium]|nr:YabP/YqfC family sporulation protein [Clostridia bacterium]